MQSTACGDVSAAAIGRFPFPSEREITLAVRNSNYSLGPVMLHLKMRPGSVIPAHIHDGVAEVLYIVEGGFMNEGRPHAVGTSLHVKADQSHGPHPTKNGCTILALWSDKGAIQNANLDDFKVTTPVEA